MMRTATLFYILVMLALALSVLSFLMRDSRPVVAENREVATTTYSDGYDYDSSLAWMCNGDGKVCPDGTVVARSGPRCEFTRCPGVIPVSGGVADTKDMGVLAGTVTLSPTCPVERFPADPSCAPAPYETIVHILKNGKEVAMKSTTAQGGFILELSPGTYTVRAESAQVFPRCNDFETVVKKDERTSITIDCDSGIR